jgi:hypothetical protein
MKAVVVAKPNNTAVTTTNTSNNNQTSILAHLGNQWSPMDQQHTPTLFVWFIVECKEEKPRSYATRNNNEGKRSL